MGNVSVVRGADCQIASISGGNLKSGFFLRDMPMRFHLNT
jgi:hypothetical protein